MLSLSLIQMTDKLLAARVAVENANFSFDKLYDYFVPEELKGMVLPGCRVKVSFGHGLRQGMVFALRETGSIEGLKKISLLIDKEPVMSGELLSLAAFMKNRCYCTYFDACQAMLPAGLSVKLTYSYSAVKDVSAEELLLSEDEKVVFERLLERKRPVREDNLLKSFGLRDNGILKALEKKGAVIKSEAIKRKIADKTVKMICLTDHVPERKYSPAQSEVIKTLEDIGEASVKELSYFTGASSAVMTNLVKLGICRFFEAEPPKAEPQQVRAEVCTEQITLTPRQNEAFESMLSRLESGKPSVTLLYGVTGSGKTSVFMKLVDRVNEQGRGVICMVPEISLTPQLLAKFRARYGDRVAVFHSGLSLGERLEQWRAVKEGRANIAVGTRSAIFAPMENIGLIVMDEEQEYSYKSSAAPRFHARELAKFRCNENKCLLVLSSATPSVESFQHAVSGRYDMCRLDSRYGSAKLPHVVTADMNIEQQQGNTSGYSSVLLEAVAENLESGQQSILLLNRRGHNTFIACRECCEVISCPNCSISLTYHSANHRLMCHYCGYSVPVPESCPSCGSKKIRYSGAGTQRAEQEIAEIFPKARILRLDTDSTMRRYAYEKKLAAFRNGEYDIMLGTQMVAKGLDFPNVTLVGVLSADGMMHSDDYRSYERTFSLLTQVVGRSGRGGLEGRAVIQTYEPQDPVIELAAAQNYDEFFKTEIALRKAMLYPPFADIAVIAFAGTDKDAVQKASEFFAQLLRESLRGEYSELPIRMLGPAPASVSKVGGKYRFRIILKFKNTKRFREMLSSLLCRMCTENEFRDVTVYADVDPDNIM